MMRSKSPEDIMHSICLALLGAMIRSVDGDVLDIWDDCNRQQYVPQII